MLIIVAFDLLLICYKVHHSSASEPTFDFRYQATT